MKFVFSLVCFFLSFFSEDLSQMSLYTSRLQNYIQREQETTKHQCDVLEIKENDIKQEIQTIENTFLIEKEYFRLQLKLLQQNKYEQTERIQKFNHTHYIYTKLQEEYDRIHQMKLEKENKKENLMHQQAYLESFQNQLFQRGKHLRGFKAEKKPDSGQQIKGSQNLPIYGSMKADDKSHAFSCLSQTEFDLTETSSHWIRPISNAQVSAGTWEYPQGGMHLGIDFAAPMKSEIRAPANGIILYADAPVESNNGYLGNWCGWPQGAGNSICMICSVQDELYVVTFAHLSNEIVVFPGQEVQQSSLLAYSGNSGNSTGPHTHVEVFKCTTSLQAIVDYFVETADFSFQNGWDKPATCSSYACRIRPETVF